MSALDGEGSVTVTRKVVTEDARGYRLSQPQAMIEVMITRHDRWSGMPMFMAYRLTIQQANELADHIKRIGYDEDD